MLFLKWNFHFDVSLCIIGRMKQDVIEIKKHWTKISIIEHAYVWLLFTLWKDEILELC